MLVHSQSFNNNNMELLRSGSFVAALEHALDLDEAHAATWVLRARAHFAMGSLGAARDAYARAHSNEARDEAQQLQWLISGWFDHPARLAILFPLPRCHNRCAPAAVRRCDGIYAAAPACPRTRGRPWGRAWFIPHPSRRAA